MIKGLRLLCVVALLAQQAPAAVFSVTNTADAGAGSLRQAILDANAAGGANTIAWTAGSGGALTLLSSLPGVNSLITLDVTNAPSTVTIAGAPNALALAGSVVFFNDSVPQVSTISAVISGAGSLTKTGAGTLYLTGANTFTGGSAINGGTVNVNADAALGNGGGLSLANGGTLQTAVGINSARAVTLGGNGTIDTLGLNSTFSGIINGGGALTLLGVGTVTVTGVNTYSGGTIFNASILNINNASALGSGAVNFNGGTLQTASSMTFANSMILGGAGGSLDNGGNATVFSGVISGAGALTDASTATLTLTGANSYGGGTIVNGGGTLNIALASSLGTGALTFNGGTLQTASTVTFANAITLNAGGGTLDTLGNPSIFTGVIGGAGALTVISTGTVFLTGLNTYAGGTTLSSGTLNVSNGSALGTGTLTINGAVLQAGAPVTLANAVTLAAAGGVFDTNGVDSTLSGVIGGAGSLTKNGLGTLTLSGANTYGNTVVNAGTLALGAANVLPAAKILTVNAGAAFDLATYTQTVASFVGAGTTKLALKPAVTSLGVTGNANVTGGTLSVAPAPGTVLTAGQVFTPITYGSVTGTFANIVSPAALSFTPTYNAGNMTLTTVLVPFANSGSGGNQIGVGNGLEVLRANPTGDNAAVLASLYQMTAPQLRAALDQMSPVSLASMQGVGLAASGAQSAAVSQRQAVLAAGGDQGGFHAYNVSRPSPYPGVLTAMAGAGEDDRGLLGGGLNSPWGYFVSGAATTGQLAESHTDAGSQAGYSFNSGGLTGGADYRLNEHLALGGSLGYLHGHASMYAPVGGTVDNGSARFGTYATATNGNLHANLYLGGAADYFKTARIINVTGTPRTAAASPKGTEFNANASLSWDLKTAEYGIFSPFGGLNYDRLMIGGFTETGADALNLTVDGQTAESLQSSLGLKYAQEWVTETRAYKPYVSLGWRHEFDDQSRPITARFATGVASPFTVMSGRYARDGTMVGGGLTVTVSKAVSAKFEYEGDFRSHFRSTTVNASARLKF